MNGHPRRQSYGAGIRLSDQSEVQFVFFSREVTCQQGGHLLRAAAAEVRDQQEEPWAWMEVHGDPFKSIVSTRPIWPYPGLFVSFPYNLTP